MRQPLHRPLFLLRPPYAAAERIDGMSRDLAGSSRGIAPENLHITLAAFEEHDEFPAPLFERLIEVGDALTWPALHVCLDRIAGSLKSVALRPRKAPRALNRFQQLLASGMGRAGLAMRDRWRFNAHLTLFYRDGPPFHREIAPIEWTATDFVLADSLVGAGRHVEVARWRLAGDPWALPSQYALPL